MDLWSDLIRPALFRLEAETAHALALRSLRWTLPWRLVEPSFRVVDERLRTRVAGIELDNPVGLAPGLDKAGAAVGGLGRMGFGYVVVGSFTVHPRAGNPRPRLVREPRSQAIVNSLGLPNPGLVGAIRNLARMPQDGPPVIASVAGFTAEELLEAARGVEPYARAVEIGLICPNTTAEEQADELDKLQAIASGLRANRRRPVFVKLPPFHDEAQREHVLRMVDVCADAGLDGLSVSGTMRTQHAGLAAGAGSLAGRPVFEATIRNVTAVARHARGRLAIKASGGVSSGANALTLLRAGADTVEIYSAFVYRGPLAAAHINRELLGLLGSARIRDMRPEWAASTRDASVAAAHDAAAEARSVSAAAR